MDQLKTATGRTFNCDYFNQFPPAGQVNIRILNTSLADVATVFSNPSETVQLLCGDQYLANHTKVVAIVPEIDAIRVVLGKE